MASSTATAEVVDLAETSLRDLNQRLHDLAGDATGPRSWRVLNPSGAHNIACGLDADIEVVIEGHAGYYCAGMNKLATVRVHGNAGSGLAENMMSGRVDSDRQRVRAARIQHPPVARGRVIDRMQRRVQLAQRRHGKVELGSLQAAPESGHQTLARSQL